MSSELCSPAAVLGKERAEHAHKTSAPAALVTHFRPVFMPISPWRAGLAEYDFSEPGAFYMKVRRVKA